MNKLCLKLSYGHEVYIETDSSTEQVVGDIEVAKQNNEFMLFHSFTTALKYTGEYVGSGVCDTIVRSEIFVDSTQIIMVVPYLN